jgi:hypothetical protein
MSTKEPTWPKLAINYTQKTQYFFRISKGVYDATDDVGVNEKRPDRRVPYSNIVYIGDGMTDIPAMIIAKNNGGKSIAVYPRGKEEKVHDLYQRWPGQLRLPRRLPFGDGTRESHAAHHPRRRDQ